MCACLYTDPYPYTHAHTHTHTVAACHALAFSRLKVLVARLDDVVYAKVLNAKILPFKLRKFSLAPQYLCQLCMLQIEARGGLRVASGEPL